MFDLPTKISITSKIFYFMRPCIFDLIYIFIKNMGVNTEYCSDMNGNQKFKCECHDGFEGERCEVSACPSNFCKNSGTCKSEIVDGNLIWKCDCPSPFEGEKKRIQGVP